MGGCGYLDLQGCGQYVRFSFWNGKYFGQNRKQWQIPDPNFAEESSCIRYLLLYEELRTVMFLYSFILDLLSRINKYCQVKKMIEQWVLKHLLFLLSLTAFWKLQPISAWNQKWARRRCPHILSSVFGMNSVLTSKTCGRRKTNLFFKKGTFVCLLKGFSQRMLLGAIAQKSVSHTSLAHNLLNAFWSFLRFCFFNRSWHPPPPPPTTPPQSSNFWIGF